MTNPVKCKLVEEIEDLAFRKMKEDLNMTYEEIIKAFQTDPNKYIPRLLRDVKIIVKDVKQIGSGSYSDVYEAKYTPDIISIIKTPINVAIKVIEIINTKDKLEDLSKEVKLLNEAYKYRPYDTSYIVPKIYKCVFFCDKKHECQGIQIIIMELGVPFNIMLENEKVSMRYKASRINTMLEHYETMIMKANIYIFDVKPSNAIISYKDRAPKIIDLGYKHVFENIDHFFNRKKLKLKENISLNDDELKLLFLTIIQLQFLLMSIRIIDKLYDFKDDRKIEDLLSNLFKKKNTAARKIITRFNTNKKIEYPIMLFLTAKKDYLPKNVSDFVYDQQTRMGNLFVRYVRLSGSPIEQYKNFITKKIEWIIKKVNNISTIPNIPSRKKTIRGNNNNNNNAGYESEAGDEDESPNIPSRKKTIRGNNNNNNNNAGYESGEEAEGEYEEDEGDEDEGVEGYERYNKFNAPRNKKNENIFLKHSYNYNIKTKKKNNNKKITLNMLGQETFFSPRNIANIRSRNNNKHRFGPSERKQTEVQRLIKQAQSRINNKHRNRRGFYGQIRTTNKNGTRRTSYGNRLEMMARIKTEQDSGELNTAEGEFKQRQMKLLTNSMGGNT